MKVKAGKHLPKLAIGGFILILSSLLCLKAVNIPSGKEAPTLRTANAQPIQYYISLPKGWSKEKKWPILVTIPGSGTGRGAYENLALLYAKERKDLPFIIVTPLVLTTKGHRDPKELFYSDAVSDLIEKIGPAKFDQDGLLAITSEVQKEFSGQDKFYITGFSAGGHLTWMMIFHYPEKIAAAVLAAGNYTGRGMDTGPISSAPERENLPIKEFQGDKDSYYDNLTGQWNTAAELARAHGYKNLSREVVPGAPHNPFAIQVLSYLSGILAHP